MDSDPRITVERLRRQLDDIRRQIESLKDERVNVAELETTVSSVEGAIEDIYPAGESDDAGKAIDISRMTLEAWMQQEAHKGIFASVADAAAAYEAAGYRWLKD
jgi:hypothetical protein